MRQISEAGRLRAIDAVIQTILDCQGWQEALRSDDPGNVTVWIGPRLHQIRQLANMRVS